MTRKQCFIAGQCFIATVRETQNSTIHKRHAALVGLATFQKKNLSIFVVSIGVTILLRQKFCSFPFTHDQTNP